VYRKNDQLVAHLRQPFDLVARSATVAVGQSPVEGEISTPRIEWLRFVDAYKKLCWNPPLEMKLLLDQLREGRVVFKSIG
jgi:hypothetical protein